MASRQTIRNSQLGRFSTQSLEQKGAKRTVRNVNGAKSNTYSQNKGGETFLSPDAIRLAFTNTESGSVDPDLFSVVFCYFEKVSKSKKTASTMALVLIDAAKFQGINPLTLLETAKSGKLNLVETIYPYINLLRGAGDQHERVRSISNSNSPKARGVQP
tara:strand:+ start:14114 stop:14590 length:477 start_codon:yes stop_codon:yes gene_type:complete